MTVVFLHQRSNASEEGGPDASEKRAFDPLSGLLKKPCFGSWRHDDPVADRPLRLSEASVPVLIATILQKDNHGGQDNPEEGGFDP